MKGVNMEKFLKNERGITLVALIITIIVLILLSAITILELNEYKMLNTVMEGSANYQQAEINMDKWIQNTQSGLDSIYTVVSEGMEKVNKKVEQE